jgi:periplasmic divalent cation tolerance protein
VSDVQPTGSLPGYLIYRKDADQVLERRNPGCYAFLGELPDLAGTGAQSEFLMSIVICLVTAPSQEVGAQLAKSFVEQELAACVNVLPAVQSVYRWQGSVTIDEEVLLVIKTAQERVSALEAAVLAEHPYETPEFVVLHADAVSGSYAKWVVESVNLKT